MLGVLAKCVWFGVLIAGCWGVFACLAGIVECLLDSCLFRTVVWVFSCLTLLGFDFVIWYFALRWLDAVT